MCFTRASNFAINYFYKFRKLLACLGTICERQPAQGIRLQKVKLLLYFLRKTMRQSKNYVTAGL